MRVGLRHKLRELLEAGPQSREWLIFKLTHVVPPEKAVAAAKYHRSFVARQRGQTTSASPSMEQDVQTGVRILVGTCLSALKGEGKITMTESGACALVDELSGRIRLTPSKVREIRASSESFGVLAKRYGVGPNQIWRVRTRRVWATVS